MTSIGSADDVNLRVLVLAPRGRDATLIGTVLAAAGIKAEACATASELASRMREGAGSVLIAWEALARGYSEVVEVMDSQPSWSDFPVILLAKPEHPLTAVCEDGLLSSAAILPRPLAPETLISVVRVALRARRRQYQLQIHLAAQQQRTTEVLEGVYDGYLSMDWQWRCIYVNRRGAALLGCGPEDLVGENLLNILPRWTTGKVQALVQDCMATGQPFSIEEQGPPRERWLEIRGGRSVDGFSLFFNDITRRKKVEKHLRLVVNELSHRVKNTLAVIQAMADQTFRTGGTLESIQAAFKGRLWALAETHTLLTQAHWESVDLAALVESSVGHLSGGLNTRVRAAGTTVRLVPKAALAISMTLHELSTNAVKYGALSGEEGSVEVNWKMGDGALVIEWREQAVTRVAPPTRRGFGTVMIEQAIVYELEGEVARDYRPFGLYCLLTIPQESALAV